MATKTRKEVPVDEAADNAKFLIRAGYIHKVMAGVYSFLPLGLRSLENIIRVIREEMNAVGGQEVCMSGLQNPEVWRQSERWDGDMDGVWFRSQLGVGGDIGFGWTHEEPITEMMRNHIHSYRDLPVYLYQFQTKFRNEKRAKSGIMRTREFIMKDLYSFCADEKQHVVFYEQMAEAYMRVFNRLGIGGDTYRTYAAGGAFSDFSDEFQTVTPVGEDVVYLHREKRVAVNQEVGTDAVFEKLGLRREELEKVAASEVGNIFTLGTRFSDALNLMYDDEEGTQKPVFMGSYGIGPARVLGVITEKYADDKGNLTLPVTVAPFTVHLLVLGESDELVAEADAVYQDLVSSGVEVLYDDRHISAGEKFADNDLIGIPFRLVVSGKTHKEKRVECFDKVHNKEHMIPINEVSSAVKDMRLSAEKEMYA